jgi:LEA14-like dessication related protein
MQRFLLLLLIVFLSSCYTYKDIEYKSFEGVNVEKIEGDDLHIGISVKVFNPNNYAIKIKEADFIASFNGKDLGPIKLMSDLHLQANQESTQKIICKVSSSKILSMLPMAFLTGNSKLSLNGNLKVKVFLFSKNIPVNIAENINLNDLSL